MILFILVCMLQEAHTNRLWTKQSIWVWWGNFWSIISCLWDGQPHPSAHLMKGNALAASGVFEETMTILKNAIVRCCTDICKWFWEDNCEWWVEGRSRWIKETKGRVSIYDKVFVQWRQVVWRLLNTSDLYVGIVGHRAMLEFWIDILGPDQFITFINSFVACWLYDDHFLDRSLHHCWLHILGKDRFVTFFINGCAACWLQDDHFLDQLHYWFEVLEAEGWFVTFINKCVFLKWHQHMPAHQSSPLTLFSFLVVFPHGRQLPHPFLWWWGYLNG